jgi:hypothetical protein
MLDSFDVIVAICLLLVDPLLNLNSGRRRNGLVHWWYREYVKCILNRMDKRFCIIRCQWKSESAWGENQTTLLMLVETDQQSTIWHVAALHICLSITVHCGLSRKCNLLSSVTCTANQFWCCMLLQAWAWDYHWQHCVLNHWQCLLWSIGVPCNPFVVIVVQFIFIATLNLKQHNYQVWLYNTAYYLISKHNVYLYVSLSSLFNFHVISSTLCLSIK